MRRRRGRQPRSVCAGSGRGKLNASRQLLGVTASPGLALLERSVTGLNGPEQGSAGRCSISSSQAFAQFEQSFTTDRKTRRVVCACLGQSLNCGGCRGSSEKTLWTCIGPRLDTSHKRVGGLQKQNIARETEHAMGIGRAGARPGNLCVRQALSKSEETVENGNETQTKR